jgi:hypothetical protein
LLSLGQTHQRQHGTAISSELAEPTPFQFPILVVGFDAVFAAKSTVPNKAEGAIALEAPFHDEFSSARLSALFTINRTF